MLPICGAEPPDSLEETLEEEDEDREEEDREEKMAKREEMPVGPHG